MPRKRHVSRNRNMWYCLAQFNVMPRKRHVSRNKFDFVILYSFAVMPRKRHVSRNRNPVDGAHTGLESCLARGM